MEMTTMTEVNSERIRAHEANIDRYCHLLLTELTLEERRYLHMRKFARTLAASVSSHTSEFS